MRKALYQKILFIIFTKNIAESVFIIESPAWKYNQCLILGEKRNPSVYGIKDGVKRIYQTADCHRNLSQ